MLHLLCSVLFEAILFISATAKGVYEPMHHHHFEARELKLRQSGPAVMTSTRCPDNDGLFYATSNNYTYQIQCATTYTGEQIMTQPALGFTGCILQCASYNHNNSTSSSFCVGVNFNAATDTSSGDCTLFDEVNPTPNDASEEGSIQDAALLIYGPTGQTFATPEPQPSDVVGGILSNSPVFTSQPAPSTSSAAVAVSTAHVTNVVTVISCAPGVVNCPANGLSTSISTPPISPSISISLGGMRPLSSGSTTASGESSTPIATAVSILPSSAAMQDTQTARVTYTEHRITTLVSCSLELTTTSCVTSVSTQTITGLRTEISCSPGLCSGIMIATGTLAGMPGVFTDACVVESF